MLAGPDESEEETDEKRSFDIGKFDKKNVKASHLHDAYVFKIFIVQLKL